MSLNPRFQTPLRTALTPEHPAAKCVKALYQLCPRRYTDRFDFVAHRGDIVYQERIVIGLAYGATFSSLVCWIPIPEASRRSMPVHDTAIVAASRPDAGRAHVRRLSSSNAPP